MGGGVSVEIIIKQITIEEIDILRESLDKLHEYHNSKSICFSGSYPRITFEERIEQYKKMKNWENTGQMVWV